MKALKKIENDLKGFSGRTCLFCNQTFTAKTKFMDYCSKACQKKAAYRRNKLEEKKLPGKYKIAK